QPPDLGRVWLGQERSARLWVRNDGPAAAPLDSVLLVPAGAPGVTLGDLAVPVTPLAAGDSLVVATVRFRPQVEGALRDLAVRVTGPGLERTVALQGEGIRPPTVTVYLAGRLLAAQDTVALDSVPSGQQRMVMLEVRNTGQDTLHLASATTSHAAFRAQHDQPILAPGQTADLEVTFAPTQDGVTRSRLLLGSNDPASPYRLWLRGSTPAGTPILSYAPADTLLFGVVPAGEEGWAAVRLRNRGRGVLQIQLRSADPRFIPEETDTVRLAAGQQREVPVRFAPDRAGWQEASLELRSNDPVIPRAFLVLRGLGGGLRFEPLSVDFGEVVVEAQADTTLWLVNESPDAVMLPLELVGSGFTVSPLRVSVAPGERLPLQVRFRPRYDDVFSARLGSWLPGLSASLYGTGVRGAALRVSHPQGRDFGQVELGQTAGGVFLLGNEGAGVLRIGDLSTSRLAYQVPQAQDLPLLLDPGAELELQVTFTPQEEGEAPASLLIVSNDAANPMLVRLLNGRGVRGPARVPHLVLSGDEEGTVDFGILDLGETAEQELLVGNTGTGALCVDQIRASESQVSAEPESLIVAAGASRRVRLRLQPDARQGTQGILRVVSNDPERPVVRLRYQYTLSVPEFVVLSEPLVFGRAQGGQRRAPLAVLNRGNAQGIVELSDASGELSFDQERLVIAAGQVGRAQATYAGRGGGGQLVLVTNSPAQRQLTVAWQAPAVLEVTASVPAAGETGVALETVLSLVFNRPLRRAGGELAGDPGPAGAALDVHLVPEPLNPWQQGIRVQGREVRISLQLAPEQEYRVVVLGAAGQEGEPLTEPFELSFSTGAQPLPDNRLAGRAVFADGRPLQGTVFLADAERRLVGSAPVAADGSYELRRIPPGQYALFAQEEGTGLSYAHEPLVTVGAGESLLGVDLVLPVQSDVQEVFGRAAIAEAVEVPAEAVVREVDSTFVVTASTQAVRDLTGFVVQVSFDPQQVALLAVTPEGPEQRNVLQGAGGFPVFLTLVIDAGTVEYGGSLLGATAATAPDDGGLLACFTFKARVDSGSVQVDPIRRRTLHGEDIAEGRRVRFRRERAPCVGDLDGNGEVDFTDFFLFADAFGRPPTGSYAAGDLDGDGAIDFSDFFVFADAFGRTCRAARLPLLAAAVSPAALSASWSQREGEGELLLRLADGYPAQGLGALVSYELGRLRYRQVESAAGTALVTPHRPGLLLVAMRWPDGRSTPVRLLFDVLGRQVPTPVLVDAAVREADRRVRALQPARMDVVPTSYALHPSYPNPSNPGTTIAYQLPQGMRVTLAVYDVLGQRVRLLVDEVQEAGHRQVRWDGHDDGGGQVASGVYLCRLQAGPFTAVRKMVVVR
ncbi:MAG: choice-of-anchor D domain-containing protein, partial [Candidatus Latescibacterota bacterium]